MIKSKYLNSFIFIYILSFMFVDSLFFDTSNNLRIYYTDIFFLIFFLLTLVFYFKRFFLYVANLNNYNFFEYIIFLILFIKFYKFFLNFNNFSNLHELLRFSYILVVYVFFKFLIINLNGAKNLILNLFITIFLISILIIILSLTIYLFGFKNLPIELWQVKNVQYPYLGKNVVHFDGFLNYYNMQAYIMIPGFFILISKNFSSQTLLSFASLCIFCIVLFIIKSKILILVSSIGFFYLVILRLNSLKYKKIILFFLIFLICILYLFMTHFLIISTNSPITFNNDYNLYFTSEPIFSLYQFNFYGSLFFKLKIIAIEHLKSFNFIFFNSLSYGQFFIEYSSKTINDYSTILSLDPHSEIFSAMSNYGLIGLILTITFLFYPFYNLAKTSNFNDFLNKQNLSISLICIIFTIESFNADIVHFRFYWILLAILTINLSKKVDNKLKI